MSEDARAAAAQKYVIAEAQMIVYEFLGLKMVSGRARRDLNICRVWAKRGGAIGLTFEIDIITLAA